MLPFPPSCRGSRTWPQLCRRHPAGDPGAGLVTSGLWPERCIVNAPFPAYTRRKGAAVNNLCFTLARFRNLSISSLHSHVRHMIRWLDGPLSLTSSARAGTKGHTCYATSMDTINTHSPSTSPFRLSFSCRELRGRKSYQSHSAGSPKYFPKPN